MFSFTDTPLVARTSLHSRRSVNFSETNGSNQIARNGAYLMERGVFLDVTSAWAVRECQSCRHRQVKDMKRDSLVYETFKLNGVSSYQSC